jgi:hypothetical protein
MQEHNKDQNSQQLTESNETKIYLTPNSTLQTPDEDRHDKSIDPRKDNTIAVSNDALHETNADRFAGGDRPGMQRGRITKLHSR